MKPTETDVNNKCFICGHDVVWDSDEMRSDVDDGCTDDLSTISFYHCSHCGRYYEVCTPDEEDREMYYSEYWYGKSKITNSSARKG